MSLHNDDAGSKCDCDACLDARMKEFNLGEIHRYLGREYRLDGIAIQPDYMGGLMRLEFTPVIDPRKIEPPVLPSQAWRDMICVCEGEHMHVHCPWGGEHVHYVNDEGNDVPPPEGFRLRAVYRDNAYFPPERHS
jgi:hypothetical protein